MCCMLLPLASCSSPRWCCWWTLGKSWGPCASSPPFGSFVLEELSFFLNSPASLPWFNASERSQCFKRIKIKKKEKSFPLKLFHSIMCKLKPYQWYKWALDIFPCGSLGNHERSSPLGLLLSSFVRVLTF